MKLSRAEEQLMEVIWKCEKAFGVLFYIRPSFCICSVNSKSMRIKGVKIYVSIFSIRCKSNTMQAKQDLFKNNINQFIMKTANAIMAITLLIMAGCRGNKSGNQTDALITVDVTANYPKKELILQDFMDVEYIALETNNDFLCQGLIQDVGKEFIIAINRNGDGNIFIFDRNGKALKIINRNGKGGEEYTGILGINLDEEKGEIFVNNYSARRIVVYDLDGNFKRTFRHKEGMMYGEIYNFDRENLICHDVRNENSGIIMSIVNAGQSFLIISKQDGSITREMHIPFEEKKTKVVKYKDETSGMAYSYSPQGDYPVVPYSDNWILVELSADTMYHYSKDDQMVPFIARTPSIQSMNPEVFLFLSMVTDRYYIMSTATKEITFSGEDLLYDKKEKAIFRYIVYNGDYSDKEKAYLKSKPINKDIPSWQYLEADQLVEDYEKGRLKGRLKEIAATLDEESNPVIMLIKHKK